MRQMDLPAEAPIGDLLLTLERTGGQLYMKAANLADRPAHRVHLLLRPSQGVDASPGELRFGSIAPGGCSAQQRVTLHFAPEVMAGAPPGVRPVYVLQFEVVIAATNERMMGAFHLSFA